MYRAAHTSIIKLISYSLLSINANLTKGFIPDDSTLYLLKFNPSLLCIKFQNRYVMSDILMIIFNTTKTIAQRMTFR